MALLSSALREQGIAGAAKEVPHASSRTFSQPDKAAAMGSAAPGALDSLTDQSQKRIAIDSMPPLAAAHAAQHRAVSHIVRAAIKALRRRGQLPAKGSTSKPGQLNDSSVRADLTNQLKWRYQILTREGLGETLGYGGQGFVRRARHPVSGKFIARKYACITAKEIANKGLGELVNELALAALVVAGHVTCDTVDGFGVASPLDIYLSPEADCKQALQSRLQTQDFKHISEQRWQQLDGQPGLLLVLDYKTYRCNIDKYLTDVLHRVEHPQYVPYQELVAGLQGTGLGSRTLNVMVALDLLIKPAKGMVVLQRDLQLIHCDIKPSNFLITHQCSGLDEKYDPNATATTEVVVSDLGCATLQCQQIKTDRLCSNGASMGSAMYMGESRYEKFTTGKWHVTSEDELQSMVLTDICIILGCHTDQLMALYLNTPLWLRLLPDQAAAQRLQAKLPQLPENTDVEAWWAWVQRLHQQGPAGRALVATLGVLAQARVSCLRDSRGKRIHRSEFTMQRYVQLLEQVQAEYAPLLVQHASQFAIIRCGGSSPLVPHAHLALHVVRYSLQQPVQFGQLCITHPDTLQWLKEEMPSEWPSWLEGEALQELQLLQQQWQEQQAAAQVSAEQEAATQVSAEQAPAAPCTTSAAGCLPGTERTTASAAKESSKLVEVLPASTSQPSSSPRPASTSQHTVTSELASSSEPTTSQPATAQQAQQLRVETDMSCTPDSGADSPTSVLGSPEASVSDGSDGVRSSDHSPVRSPQGSVVEDTIRDEPASPQAASSTTSMVEAVMDVCAQSSQLQLAVNDMAIIEPVDKPETKVNAFCPVHLLPAAQGTSGGIDVELLPAAQGTSGGIDVELLPAAQDTSGGIDVELLPAAQDTSGGIDVELAHDNEVAYFLPDSLLDDEEDFAVTGLCHDRTPMNNNLVLLPEHLRPSTPCFSQADAVACTWDLCADTAGLLATCSSSPAQQEAAQWLTEASIECEQALSSRPTVRMPRRTWSSVELRMCARDGLIRRAASTDDLDVLAFSTPLAETGRQLPSLPLNTSALPQQPELHDKPNDHDQAMSVNAAGHGSCNLTNLTSSMNTIEIAETPTAKSRSLMSRLCKVISGKGHASNSDATAVLQHGLAPLKASSPVKKDKGVVHKVKKEAKRVIAGAQDALTQLGKFYDKASRELKWALVQGA